MLFATIGMFCGASRSVRKKTTRNEVPLLHLLPEKKGLPDMFTPVDITGLLTFK